MAEQKYQQSPQADATLAGDRVAIFHRETRKAITLNPVGTLLWQYLAQAHAAPELVRYLQEKFPQVPEDTLTADVANFLEQLTQNSLLEPAA